MREFSLYSLSHFWFKDKIVQRFYETPENLSSGSNKRKAKIPIPADPKTGFPLRFNMLLGYFGIFSTAHRAVVPHFRFKKDLILYLNSSRAAPKVGISVSLQQAAGNSNLNIKVGTYPSSKIMTMTR